ncbi:MAG: hypothetical protein IKO05_11885 [Selenomonadaceae bacterium]|nr:hypothetical protein [Selenomonadaceae bacterium]
MAGVVRQGMVRRGMVWQGQAWCGKVWQARRGLAWQGKVWHGMAGKARLGVVRQGLARFGEVWRGWACLHWSNVPNFRVLIGGVLMAEELKSISTFYAGNGRPFDLLATDDLKQFYIDLEQLAASTDDYHGLPIGTTSAEALAEKFDSAFTAVVNGEKTYVVSVEFYELRFSQNFPIEIFEAVKRPFPAPVKVLETPLKSVYTTGGKNPNKQILIYENADEYLIDLGNINYLLTGSCDWSPALVKAVLRAYKVYTWRHCRYFCSLDAVPDIFTDIGTKEARKLARRFERQVFMTPTPEKINFVKLNCKLFHDEP